MNTNRCCLSQLTLSAITAGCWLVCGVSGGAELAVQQTSAPKTYEFTYAGKPIMSYESDPQKYKPYVKSLCAVGGYNVLRDSPFDHLHHHALMYGIRVNGVNFWEELPGAGVQKVVEFSAPWISTSAEGLPQARLAQVIHWLEPEFAFLPASNAPALLIERRTITLQINPARRETALQWLSEFEVGTRTNMIVLTGANYHGLGARFAQELDPVATHFAVDQKPDLSNNRQDTSVFAWQAVAFDKPGNPLTFAMYGHPSNARGHARFFAMKTPFAYLSASQTLDKEPLVYKRGDKFALNYLITVHPEIKTADSLEARYREWAR